MDKKRICPYCNSKLIKNKLGEDYYVWICPGCNYKELYAPISFDDMMEMMSKH